MKSQHNICGGGGGGDGSVTEKESKRTIQERIGQVYEAAVVAMGGSYGSQNQEHRSGSSSISKEIERRRRWSYRTEDPIRTIMFLGSWSHT